LRVDFQKRERAPDGEAIPILPRNMESDPEKMKLLARWKDTLQSRHTISPF